MLENDQNIQLVTLDGGRVVTQGVRFLAADGREELRSMADPNHCYLVRHPRGLLMWDTGLPDSIAAMPEQTLVRGRFNFIVHMPLVDQLRAIGISPEDIDYLAFSHLQIDHAGNAGLFPNATVLLQSAEVEMAFSAEAGDWGYHLPDYEALSNQRLVRLDGDWDVFGDGKVVILSAPGHTPGHQVLFLDLPDPGPVLLSGDLYYAQKDPAEGWIPAWNYDKEATRQTLARLQAFAESHGAAWVINHQPE